MTGVCLDLMFMQSVVGKRWASVKVAMRQLVKNAVTSDNHTTKSILTKLKSCYPKLYATLHIFSFRFTVTKNDLIVCHRLKGVRLGDVLTLNRVREIGSPDGKLVGRPWINPNYYTVEACVIEHGKGDRTRCRLPYKRKGIRRERYSEPLTTVLRVRDVRVNVPVIGEVITASLQSST